MGKGYIGKRKMERYRKQYNLKRLKIILPRLEDISNITNKLRSNGAANFLRNEPSSFPEENLFLRSPPGRVIDEQRVPDSPMDNGLTKFKNLMDKFLEGIPRAEKKDATTTPRF